MPERAYPKAKFQSDKYKVFPFQCSVKYEFTRLKFIWANSTVHIMFTHFNWPGEFLWYFRLIYNGIQNTACRLTQP
jgi:hypothetical protein